MESHLGSADARFIFFRDGKPLIRTISRQADDPAPASSQQESLLIASRAEAEPFFGDSGVGFAPVPPNLNDAESKYHQAARVPNTLPALVFLGIDDRPSSDSPNAVPAKVDPHNPQGVPYFAIDVPHTVDVSSLTSSSSSGGAGASFQDARAAASNLSPWEAGIFAEARAMVDWNTRNKHCPACGKGTYSLWAGWKRCCVSVLDEGGLQEGKACPSTKGLQNFSYPRTDPVSLMAIRLGLKPV